MKLRIIHPVLVVLALGLNTQVLGATYKIATISPDGLSWMKKLRSGIAEISERTDGRVKFKLYPGGVQGDDATVLRKMRIGQLHGGAVAAGSLTRFYPDLQIYNLPLQFSDYDEVDHIRAEMDTMIADGLEEAGIVTFAFAETGFAYLLTKTPVRTVEELKDLKAWIPDGDPIAAELIKAFDVSPIPLNLTDVLAGLQTGMINAVVVPPTVALALQWHNHVDYITDLPLVYIYSMLAMDRKAYRRISDEDKVVVREVLDGLFASVGAENRVDNDKAMIALKSIGIETVSVPDESLGQWMQVAERAIEELMDSGEISPASVNLYLQNLESYRQGSE
jgi:TRAP-type C4-dicarboxylate transport system substrate-binding protein